MGMLYIPHRLVDAFASDNEKQGEVKDHEVGSPYTPLLRRPAHPANSIAREELETNINELMKLGTLRNVGNNEEVEVTNPVIITWNNDK
ncbi:hypothetical protein O181_081181 [Austropuccinia psidii MF-1]|uniref:Uncharacterized protein n=1 Tax=Austropuccinia psidii MF-1 TaxID=1389203 RepID=A0A9Q3IFP0_9BASI|nr:hypothetical protein [Austropuccinia psidii MF-1]